MAVDDPPSHTEAQKKERQRRAGASQLNLPFSRPDEKVMEMVSTGEALFVFTNYSTFEVITPDKIDPKVEGASIPWAVVKHFSEGSRQTIIARTILQVISAKGLMFIDQKNTEEFCKKVMPITVALMECYSIFDVARNEIDAAIEDVQKNYEKLRAGPSAIVIPSVHIFDAAARSFFGSAKRSISYITSALIDLLNLKGVSPGRLDKLNQKLSANNDFEGLLLNEMKNYERIARYITETRNAIEHPDKNKYFESRNFSLDPARQLIPPAWRLICRENDDTWYDFIPNAQLILESLTGLAEAGLMLAIVRNSASPFPFYVAHINPSERNAEMPLSFKFSFQPMQSK
jgi:hypothetical protein